MWRDAAARAFVRLAAVTKSPFPIRLIPTAGGHACPLAPLRPLSDHHGHACALVCSPQLQLLSSADVSGKKTRAKPELGKASLAMRMPTRLLSPYPPVPTEAHCGRRAYLQSCLDPLA